MMILPILHLHLLLYKISPNIIEIDNTFNIFCSNFNNKFFIFYLFHYYHFPKMNISLSNLNILMYHPNQKKLVNYIFIYLYLLSFLYLKNHFL